ncbi:unnamed protein product [Bursaphelenchus xylophilus]|uniref:(pine wood nematode) hypothetical protein n=1 Tax=Bursaphelenchus xylophilus TaxID=6326 RepID=A0A1I7S7U2_BURXY|nr:unnamed protein product [Bursaphelenchus xylophilus]CAG9087025.1 unnamed protein product [Bursaphelenchus xylophilus]
MGVFLNKSELPSDGLLVFYGVCEKVTLTVSTIFVGVTATVVLKGSTKALSTYKYYILHELVWSYIFDVFATFMGIVALFPIPCYYSISTLQYFDLTWQGLYLLLVVVTLMGRIFGTAYQIAYRFFKALPQESLLQLINFTKHGLIFQVVVLAIVFVLITAIITTPVILQIPNQGDQRAYLTNLDSDIAKIFHQHPNTFCFGKGDNLKSQIEIASYFLFLTPFLIFFVILSTYFYIRRGRHIVSSATYRLQIMLFQSLVAQSIGTGIFLIIPAIFYFTPTIYGVRDGPKISVVALICYLLHAPFDCCSTKPLSIYKYYILHELFWAYLFDFMATFLGFVVLFPVPCFYSVSTLADADTTTLSIYALVAVITLFGRIFGTAYQIVYRFLKATPLDSIFWYINFTKHSLLFQVTVLIIVFIVLTAVIVTPVVLEIPDQKEERAYLSSRDPFLAQFFIEHPNAVCFGKGETVEDQLMIATYFIFATPFLVTGANLYTHYYVRRGRNMVSAATYRVQIMLFQSLVAQSIGLIIFLIIPGIFFFTPTVFGFRNGPTVSVISFLFYLLHSPFDCCIILIFIKPYRQYVVVHFKRVVKVSKEKRVSSAPQTIFVEDM